MILLVLWQSLFHVCWASCSRGLPSEAFYKTAGIYDDQWVRDLETTARYYEVQSNPAAQRTCKRIITCNSQYPYRTYDGSCNNLRNALIGAEHSCYARLLKANFKDNIAEPVTNVDVATIYNKLQYEAPVPEPLNFSVLFASIQQLAVHDMMETALTELVGSSDCCSKQNANHPQCSMRINVSQATPYKEANIECMTFLRTARCPCVSGPTRESMNLQSGWLDLSHVYRDGRSRDPVNPRLLSFSMSDVGELPPLDHEPSICYVNDGHRHCFGGDKRMNQLQTISVFHIIYYRLHNTHANNLKKLNPFWSETTIFEEARKITIANWQYLFFGDLADIMFDRRLLEQSGVHIDQLRRGSTYDPNTQLNTFAEIVHAALRAHVLVPDKLGNQTFQWITAAPYYHDNTFLRDAIVSQFENPVNPNFPAASPISHDMMKRFGEDRLGLSMVMINLQRGRDVGLPTYKTAAEWASGTKINCFDDLVQLNYLTKQNADFLENIYGTVDQVELWVGLTLGKPYGTGFNPEISQKIRILHHKALVFGDRHFFSHRTSFSDDQRKAIFDYSFSQALCETIALETVPKAPLYYSKTPELLQCSDFKPFDYNPWRVGIDIQS